MGPFRTASAVILTFTVVAGLTPARSPQAPAPTTAPQGRTADESAAIRWILDHQLPGGGWGQGEESAAMGAGGELRDVANVADTCMATLALMRGSSTPSKGPHAQAVRRGIEHVLAQVEKSPATGLSVTDVNGTRLQSKLGPHVDTFLAALLLAEAKGKMPDAAADERLGKALDKVLSKIQSNQRPDGTWSDEGWAPVISQQFAAAAINKAAQVGVKVDEQVRERAEKHARGQLDSDSGRFAVGGAAGVELYGAASSLKAMQDSAMANEARKDDLQAVVASPSAPAPEKAEAKRQLDRYRENEEDLRAAQEVVLKKMSDPAFVSGFGSNGGEEFLSYLAIGESLFQRGGKDWKDWHDSMSRNLGTIQNADGSWTGHHCVTGRTTCTAAALLVLTIDRAGRPVHGSIRG